MYTGSTHRHINLYSSACLPSNNKKRSASCNNHGFQYIRLHKKGITPDYVIDLTEKDIEAKSKELEEALKGGDIENIKAKKEALTKASQSVAMKAYQKAQQAQQGNNNNTKEDSDTVDADYTDVE